MAHRGLGCRLEQGKHQARQWCPQDGHWGWGRTAWEAGASRMGNWAGEDRGKMMVGLGWPVEGSMKLGCRVCRMGTRVKKV